MTQGFLLGFLVIGPPFGLLAGALIDRIGARWVILSGIGLVGFPLIAMGFMSHFWEYQFLCILEVMGYVLAGPIANQVLVSHWFQARRGRAMGFAYLGLGVGGAEHPLNQLADPHLRMEARLMDSRSSNPGCPLPYWVVRHSFQAVGHGIAFGRRGISRSRDRFIELRDD